MGTSTDAILGWGYAWEEEDLGIPEEHDSIYDWIESLKAPKGIEVGIHCCGSCPMLYVCVKEQRAWRGYPKKVDLREPSEELKEKLRRFAAKMGVELPKGDPGWFICSYWSA